ncbi:MAG: glycosyltransferase family 39 protein [Chloroflexi bacterium]|nr:glycosyltransferase family 39 protein [Chloroflexota bacterium]
MQEPSVLDFLKSIFKDWNSFSNFIRSLRDERRRDEMKRVLIEEAGEPAALPAPTPAAVGRFPWRSLLALTLALAAQSRFEPPNVSVGLGIGLYGLALAMLVWSVLNSEWNLAPLRPDHASKDPQTVRAWLLILGVILAVAAFAALGDNKFTIGNLVLWLAALAFCAAAFWLPRPRRSNQPVSINWGWVVLVVAASALVIFFRVYRIQQTPGEPFSDHAEKLLDVYDITQGETSIFFPRNTGREAIQMYWTVLMSWIFGTGISFLSLKIGTVLFGLMTLPYIYLLGREVGSERVGFLAFVFAGIAYWPNVISRIGLRFPLYPLFAAPTLFYLIRGLRTRNRNDFILSGLFLGLGLHGYSPARIVPLLVVIAFLLYMLHSQSKGVRRDALAWLIVVGFISLIVFLPLLRYALDNPDMFSYRAFSRLGTLDAPLPAPWYQIFASNFWNALRMFNLDDGNIWVNSLPHRPALDLVSGALFLIGIALVTARYFQKRHWLDLFLLLSIPILQLPSTLSLAYPEENPALNRAGGALVPVFIIAALALDGLWSAFGSDVKRKVFAWAVMGVLLFSSVTQNFDLVFNQFDTEYRLGSWNSSEMGAVIQGFGATYGETDTVWIVPFPYWVDTRLPGAWAGIPNRDFAVWPADLAGTLQLSGPKLFMVKANTQNAKANDQQTLDTLKQLYPQGSLTLRQSPVPGHDFWIFFVPAQ